MIGWVLVCRLGIELDHEFECFFLGVSGDHDFDDAWGFGSESCGHGADDHGLDAGFGEHVFGEHGFKLCRVSGYADWFIGLIAHD